MAQCGIERHGTAQRGMVWPSHLQRPRPRRLRPRRLAHRVDQAQVEQRRADRVAQRRHHKRERTFDEIAARPRRPTARRLQTRLARSCLVPLENEVGYETQHLAKEHARGLDRGVAEVDRRAVGRSAHDCKVLRPCVGTLAYVVGEQGPGARAGGGGWAGRACCCVVAPWRTP
eukprot:353058-Chlamydomonas_euryale.AAC.5